MEYSIQKSGIYKKSDQAHTMSARDYKDATDLIILGGGDLLNEPTMMSNRKGHNSITENGTSTTLTAQEKERPIVGTSIVRRLTPLECERLQGFPDNWTLIGEESGEEIWKDEYGNEYPIEVYKYRDSSGKLKKVSDSERYRALGNSIALPFWFYLLRRISAQYERPATMGSLFSGIGGFDLCWERCNGKGTVLWTSEIDEFCNAVLRERFGE